MSDIDMERLRAVTNPLASAHETATGCKCGWTNEAQAAAPSEASTSLEEDEVKPLSATAQQAFLERVRIPRAPNSRAAWTPRELAHSDPDDGPIMRASLTLDTKYGAALWLDGRYVARIEATTEDSRVSAEDPIPRWRKDAMVFVDAVNGQAAVPSKDALDEAIKERDDAQRETAMVKVQLGLEQALVQRSNASLAAMVRERDASEASTEALYVVTDGLPGPGSGTASFVELETADGRSRGSESGPTWSPHPTSKGLCRLGPFYAAAPSEVSTSLGAALRVALVTHYVTAVECDHEAKTDTVRCSCSVWTGTPQPSVGAAVRQWADHAIAAAHPAMRPYATAHERAERLAEALREVLVSFDHAIVRNETGKCVLDALMATPPGANGPITIAAYESLVRRLLDTNAVATRATDVWEEMHNQEVAEWLAGIPPTDPHQEEETP